MKLNLNKMLMSSLLTGVLMLPYLGSFTHIFEDHDHKTCEISETHLHELELDCDILDYQFAPTTEVFSKSSSLIVIRSQQKKFSFFYLGDSFSIDTHDTLRGPPKG